MDYEHILVEREGGVAVLTMNRPEQLNAIVRLGDDRYRQQSVDRKQSLGVRLGEFTQVDACHAAHTSLKSPPEKRVSPAPNVCARKRGLGRDARSGYSTTAIARQHCHAGDPGDGAS